MPILTEMDPSGPLEQVPKKPEKHSLITNFFKSPPNNKNKQQPTENKDSSLTQAEEKSNNENRGGADPENDLNNSLCDFEPSPQVKISKPSVKSKVKKPKKEKGKIKPKRPKKPKYDNEEQDKNESIELPCDELGNLSLMSPDRPSEKQQSSAMQNGSGDINTNMPSNVSKEISYEDFLRSGFTEEPRNSPSKAASNSTEKKESPDDSVVLLDESVDVSVQEVSPKKKRISETYCTILQSSQFKASKTQPRPPVVITVNVPDSPIDKSKNVKSFGIFNKSTAKSGFEKCNESVDKDLTSDDQEKVTEDNESLKVKGSRTKTSQPKRGRGKKAESDVCYQTEESSKESTAEKSDVDSEAQQKVVANKMASLDQVVIKSTGKATQSTLCFGQLGLTTVKSPPPIETKPSDKKIAKAEKTDGKSRKLKNESKPPKAKVVKKRTKKSKKLESDSDDFETDVMKTPTLKRRRRSEKSSDTDVEVVEVEENEEGQNRRRRRSRRLYSSAIVESPIPMKKAPIKLRFTRLAKSVEEEESRALKVNKAQQILQKAKAGKKKTPSKSIKGKKSVTKKTASQKGKQHSNDTKIISPTPRRSSRSCNRAASRAITQSTEESEKKQSSKKVYSITEDMTPNKKSKKQSEKTPCKPKKKGKIAPIFMKKSNSPITIDSDEETPPEKVIDPEVLKAQRSFLLSGVPEKLKKARAIVETLYGDYPPLPEVNHVQQIPTIQLDTGINPWKLPVPHLKFRSLCSQSSVCLVPGSKLNSGLFTKIGVNSKACGRPNLNLPVNEEKFSEDLTKYLLGEISLYNPQYPVKRMFKQLKKKKSPSEEPKTENDPCKDDPAAKSESKEQPKNRKSRKRKLEDEMNHAADAEVGGKKLSLRRNKRRKGTNGAVEECLEERETKDNGAVLEQQKSSVGAESQQKPSTDSVSADADILWTEKYQPTAGADILGNTKQVKKMWTWLKEWKDRTDMEIKRLKKQLMKEARSGKITKEEAKKKLGGDVWGDDDSDFDLDSCESGSESEFEDDDRLCNTMLLVGPHGVGKTATVSALANELGYKVFELNASSKRNGKHILAQLQEATQSHQVCKANLDAVYTTFASLAKNGSDKPAAQPEKKMPTAFTNFFTKKNQPNSKEDSAADNSKGETKTKKCKKSKSDGGTDTKKKTPAVKGSKTASLIAAESNAVDSPSKRKGLNLSSTSLILFEEVDVVFEEDKGFWAAIQTFISTTKRPIILTTSDASVAEIIDGKHETTALKYPSPENIASHLQTLCLVENIRTQFSDLVSVVNFCGGDVRKSMNTVQFWAKSGGGIFKEERPIKYASRFLSKTTEGPLRITFNTPTKILSSTPVKHLPIVEQLNASIDSEDEFMSLPRRRCRRKTAILSDDESSRDSFMGSPIRARPGLSTVAEEAEDSQGSQESVTMQATEVDDKDIETATGVVSPVVHTGCLDSAVLCSTRSTMLLKSLQNVGDKDLAEQESFDRSALDSDMVYNHLGYLLHLPRVAQSVRPVINHALGSGFGWKPKTLRRIQRPESDLFDSDCSSDDEDKSKGNEGSNDVKDSKVNKREKDHGGSIMVQSLTAMSDTYDNLSFSDAFLSTPSEFKEGQCSRHTQERWSSGKLTAGMSDEKKYYDEANWWKRNYCDDICSEFNSRNLNAQNTKLRKSWNDMAKLPARCVRDVKDRLTLPVPKDSLDQVRAQDETNLQLSQRSSRARTASYVADCLPSHVACQHSAMALDYLPAVRLICKSEQLRQATNTKRRFLHYFDATSLGVTRKQSVVDVLCSSFS